MTHAHNRRSFLALAEAEWDRFRRYGRPFSVLIADIDHFKAVNDRFGHNAGDKVLVRFADIFRDINRDTDVLGRLGGEEFAVLMPETNSREAARLAERLRRAVAEADVDATYPRITVSIGIAQAEASMIDLPDLMKRADIALYEAKRQGRDHVLVSDARAGRQVA